MELYPRLFAMLAPAVCQGGALAIHENTLVIVNNKRNDTDEQSNSNNNHHDYNNDKKKNEFSGKQLQELRFGGGGISTQQRVHLLCSAGWLQYVK